MRVSGSTPFPFITKEGSRNSFNTISTEEFNQDFSYGDVITGSYPYRSSISSDVYPTGLYQDLDNTPKRRLLALKNAFNHYTNYSPHYAFSSSLGNKETQHLRLISIPSIFYGQSIEKGSVVCKWYHTGSLIAELRDLNKNGEMIQVGPPGSNGSGSVAGVVLYKEGFVCLTGSWSLHSSYADNFDIYDPLNQHPPSWKYFMTTGSNGDNMAVSSSFIFDFKGTEKIPTITMLARAEQGEFNFSNNPTFIEYGQENSSSTSTNTFIEKQSLNMKNIVKTNYDEEDPPLEKTTYISRVAIYDKDKNLIGVAKVATPIRKKQSDNITFKVKMDL